MRLQNLLIKLFILHPFCLSASQYNARQAYIDRFSPIAVREMHRSQIPASITLGQGILESSSGNGELARKANSHFGVKCKGDLWHGETYYLIDDDVDSTGKKVNSCFRKYAAVLDSYIDHTNFLLDGDRYQDLFKFGRFDYKKWAKGLQEKGYATDPNYAKKLIKIIEEEHLYIYDLAENFGDVAVYKRSNFNDNAIAFAQYNESDVPTFSPPREANKPFISGRIPGNGESNLDSEADHSNSPTMPNSEPSKRMRAIYRDPNPHRIILK